GADQFAESDTEADAAPAGRPVYREKGGFSPVAPAERPIRKFHYRSLRWSYRKDCLFMTYKEVAPLELHISYRWSYRHGAEGFAEHRAEVYAESRAVVGAESAGAEGKETPRSLLRGMARVRVSKSLEQRKECSVLRNSMETPSLSVCINDTV